MRYRIKSFPNEVCNLAITDVANNDRELEQFFKILQKTAGLLLPKQPSWSKVTITDGVDVYTMPVGPGRLYTVYVIKEN